MATQKKWISDRQELITLMKERGNNIRYPYQHFPYDYKINYYLRKKIIAKIKEINDLLHQKSANILSGGVYQDDEFACIINRKIEIKIKEIQLLEPNFWKKP